MREAGTVRRSIVSSGVVLAVSLALTGCGGGGGGGSAAGTGPGVPVSGGGSTSQSNTVTPTFTLVFSNAGGTAGASSSRAPANASGRVPQYVSSASRGVAVTLLSSSGGSATGTVYTDLTTSGVCTTGTPKSCTISGPPVLPGTAQFRVLVYDQSPTGSPLAEPANAKLLSQSSSTGTPAVADPTVTITAGMANTVTIPLFGVVVNATLGTTSGVSGFTANTSKTSPIAITALDADGMTIGGQFAAPLSLTDGDTAGTYGTSLQLGSQIAVTIVLNDTTDLANADETYGGIAEIVPTFTLTGGSLSSGVTSTLYPITTNPITFTPSEVDLYATMGAGSTATFTLYEAGWSNAPYDQQFTFGTPACSIGAANTTYDVSANGSSSGTYSFLDTAPSGAVNGKCTIPVNDFPGDTLVQNETLTYTANSIVIQGRARR